MWARAKSYTDEQLSLFDVGKDLVQVRSAPTPYGSIIFGKIRIPAIVDEQGEAFVHVRYVPGLLLLPADRKSVV